MPSRSASFPVAGTVRPGGLLLLSRRLEGHDTFLTGTLRLGDAVVAVRILTFDDVTVLRPTDDRAPLPPDGPRHGVLDVSPGLRDRDVPADLADAAALRRRDVTALTGPELRYALTFLHEATTRSIREKRVDAILGALPILPGGGEGFVFSIDVGGTLGGTEGGGLMARLAAASPLDPALVRRLARDTLLIVPEMSDAGVDDFCRRVQVDRSVLAGTATFKPFEGAVEMVRELSRHGSVVTLSNVSYLEADLNRLRSVFSPWVVDHFPSCRTGYVKPDPRAFEFVAARFGVDTSNMIHVGDDWECDVEGAVGAGARAIWARRGGTDPMGAQGGREGVLVADELSRVVAHVRAIVRSSP